MWYVAVVVVAWLVAVPVFKRLTSASMPTDIMVHARLSKSIVESGGWFTYSFWYPIIYLASDGATSILKERLASIALLSIVVAAKSVLVFWLANRLLRSRGFALMITLAFLVVMPLLDPLHPNDIYLGQITPNVWHNSTTILAEPFAILAFYAAIQMYRRATMRSTLIFSAFATLSVLAKPNYALALLPVIGIAMIVVLWKRRQFPRGIALLAVGFLPAAAVLIGQYISVYVGGFRQEELVIKPFAAWEVFSSNIPLSIALSIAGPVLILFAISPEQRRKPWIVLAWLAFVVALLETIFLAELSPTDGSLNQSGNWFWGSYTAIALLFLVSGIEAVRTFRSGPLSPERRLVLFVAAIALIGHVATGIYYVLSIGTPAYGKF